jgi:hypothetical protein
LWTPSFVGLKVKVARLGIRMKDIYGLPANLLEK